MSSESNTYFEWNIFGRIIKFEPKSTLGCFLLLLPCCGLLLILLYLLANIYLILFKTVESGLGISAGVEILIWMTAIFCANVTIPLNWHPTSVCLNITGGLIPTILALYQFSRVEATAIFVVLAIVATISFCSVVVIPGVGIFSRHGILTITSLVAALCSIWIVPETDRVGVAFAGSVLGSLIGADLLHLKDLQLDTSPTPISIGGAGMDDGIVQCGLSALMFAEYFPQLVPVLTNVARLFGFTLHF